jgi:chemotaxis protein MotD
LLNSSQHFNEGSPVVSGTSEVLASASVQNATARSTRQDSSPPAGNDSFASLIDSNAAASSRDNRAQDNSPDTSAPATSQTPAPRRADDAQKSSDGRSRDNTAASDKAASDKAASDRAARSDANDRDAAVKGQDDADAGAKADKSAKSKSDTAKSSDAKSSDSKSDETKDTAAKSSGDTATADQAGVQKEAAAAVAATGDAIATIIPVAATPAVTPTAAPATDKAAAPLAIAAAAIAASTAVANGTTPADANAGTTTTANAAKPDGTKTDTQAATGEAVAAQATADTAATAGIALATPSSAKLSAAGAITATPVKTNKIMKEGIATTSANTTDAPAAATGDTAAILPAGTPQTAAKPKAESGIIDAVKGEASGNSAPGANAATHAHAATADLSQVLANSSGNGPQNAAAIQAQQPSAITAPATAAQLTVTAATNDAVPLSGVAMEIATSIQSGKSRFEIRLDPADLGRIDVRIDIDRNGQMTSHLTVEKPETLSMLRQDAPQLQRALDDAGFKTDSGGLQFSLRDQSSSGQNSGNDNGRNAQRLVISEDDTIPATAIAGRTYGRMLGPSSGVDIRI